MIEPLLSDDAFVADVESVSTDSPDLHLWWLGQSGYLARWKTLRILLDPYLSDTLTRKYASTNKPHVRMSRRVVDPARLGEINVVTSTHAHTDHLDPETLAGVRRANSARIPTFVAPRTIEALASERWGGRVDVPMNAGEKFDAGEWSIHAVAAAHDKLDNNAKGEHPYLGYVLRIGPFTVYHSGDTVVYPGMVDAVKPFAPGLAILPINGKVGNMNGHDAANLARDISAKCVVPCHYDLFEFNTADPYEKFVPECQRLGQAHRVLRLGERLTLLSDGGVK